VKQDSLRKKCRTQLEFVHRNWLDFEKWVLNITLKELKCISDIQTFSLDNFCDLEKMMEKQSSWALKQFS